MSPRSRYHVPVADSSRRSKGTSLFREVAGRLRPSARRTSDGAKPSGAPPSPEASRARAGAATPVRPQVRPDVVLGIPKLDEEHAVQLQLLRAAQEMISRNKPDMAIAVLYQLGEFTRGHFQAEEQLMKQTAYPGLAEHRNEHQLFLQQVQALLETVNESGKATTAPGTLESWLAHHIQTADRTFASYEKSHRA